MCVLENKAIEINVATSILIFIAFLNHLIVGPVRSLQYIAQQCISDLYDRLKNCSTINSKIAVQ